MTNSSILDRLGIRHAEVSFFIPNLMLIIDILIRRVRYDVPVAAGGVVPTPNGRHLINLRSGGWDPRVTLRGRGNFVIYGVRGV